jgi:hypothetical protein
MKMRFCSDTVLDFDIGPNSTLQNRLVKWCLSLTYKHTFKPSRKQCGTS